MAFVEAKKKEELDAVIKAENLNRDATEQIVEEALRSGRVPTSGIAINKVLPRGVSRFRPDNARGELLDRVIAKLQDYIDRFRPLLKTTPED